MELLRDFSLIWVLVSALIIYLSLSESRYSQKKTIAVSIATIVPLTAVNLLLFWLWGIDTYGVLMLLTFSLPGCVIFWIISKHRDGRFFFTFCMVNTVILELIYITNIINHYTTPDTYIVMFVIRLLIPPVIVFIVLKKLRPVYLHIQKYTKKGWGSFSIISLLFYIATTFLMTYPDSVTKRPHDLLALTTLFVLMPMIYANIITTLHRLQEINERSEQESLLKLQVSNITARMDEFSAADDKFRVERHNFRHKLKTIASLIKTEQYTECLQLLEEYEEALDKTKIKRYCKHNIIDAVLSSYIRKAESSGIILSMGFAFPDQLPMNETELATAIANALENAINACEKLESGERYIDIKVIDRPAFIIRISNSYRGEVEFDESGIPINHDSEHGFGTRYIAAFCEKNGGYYDFKADGETFTLNLNF